MKKLSLSIISIIFTLSAFSQWNDIRPDSFSGTSSLQMLNDSEYYLLYYVLPFGQVMNLAYTNNKGHTWNLKYSFPVDTCKVFQTIFINKDTGIIIYFSYINPGRCYVSQTFDGGLHYTNTNYYFMATGGGYLLINRFSKDIFFAYDKYLAKSSDYGKTWKQINSPKPAQDKLMFISAKVGFYPHSSGLYKTTDGGDTWVKFSDRNDFYNLYFVNENVGYATNSSTGIFKTIDGGQTWNLINSGLIGVGIEGYIWDIYFMDENTGWVLFITTGNKTFIMKTSDGGNSWTKLANTDFPCRMNMIMGVDSTLVLYDYQHNCLYQSSNGGGPVSGLEDRKSISFTYSIYPNPASNSFTIRCEGGVPCRSKLEIINLQGQCLLRQDLKEPDNIIDISTLAKGIYFVKVVDEKGVWVRKVLKE